MTFVITHNYDIMFGQTLHLKQNDMISIATVYLIQLPTEQSPTRNLNSIQLYIIVYETSSIVNCEKYQSKCKTKPKNIFGMLSSIE